MLPLEIYIHIPFCVRKCAYCDFLSGPSTEAERERYVELLCQEILECQRRAVDQEVKVVTIFFGGGTPSLLTGEQIGEIMETLRRTFSIAPDAEITMEMNPGTVTEEKLVAYKSAGINRLSIGLQSVHDEELKMLGRIHTFEEFKKSYAMAREAGFENINIDLISAIPGQTVESWEETLRTIIALEPEHISAYSLIIEPGTPFYEMYGEEEQEDEDGCEPSDYGRENCCEQEEAGLEDVKSLPDEDSERQMYWSTKKILRDAGYERYEISNYSRPGYECKHNRGYWNRVPYLGFGIGAASLVPGEMQACESEISTEQSEERSMKQSEERSGMSRYANPDTVEEYSKSFDRKFQGERLLKEEEMEEFMFLGLRKMEGISRQDFQGYFHVEIEEIYGEQIKKLEKMGLLECEDGRIHLTEKGIDVSNAVFVEFMF